MWDTYLHDGGYETGDVASDFYHHYKEDIKMMVKVAKTHYVDHWHGKNNQKHQGRNQ